MNMFVTEEYAACPFTVIVDTREQSAYSFRHIKADAKQKYAPLVIPIKRAGLKTGDYSIEGMENRVAIERKELSDLFQCMGQDRERFERQLQRLSELEYGCVMVEASLGRVRRGHEHSKLKPKTVFRSVMSYQMDRFPDVHWWFCDGKHLAEVCTFRMLQMFWRKNSDE